VFIKHPVLTSVGNLIILFGRLETAACEKGRICTIG
jgi:hypothetical protein